MSQNWKLLKVEQIDTTLPLSTVIKLTIWIHLSNLNNRELWIKGDRDVND